MPKHVHVEPARDGWSVREEGSRRSAAYRTKAEAVEAGRRLARSSGARHLVHTRGGEIEESESYGRDPFPGDS